MKIWILLIRQQWTFCAFHLRYSLDHILFLYFNQQLNSCILNSKKRNDLCLFRHSMCCLPAHMDLMKMSGISLKQSSVTMILADLMDELIGSVIFFDPDLATRPYSRGTKLAAYLVSGMEWIYLPDIQQSSFISLKMCRHMTVQPWNGAIPMETYFGCVYQAWRLFESDVIVFYMLESATSMTSPKE